MSLRGDHDVEAMNKELEIKKKKLSDRGEQSDEIFEVVDIAKVRREFVSRACSVRSLQIGVNQSGERTGHHHRRCHLHVNVYCRCGTGTTM